jgi:hypothetical protein
MIETHSPDSKYSKYEQYVHCTILDRKTGIKVPKLQS